MRGTITLTIALTLFAGGCTKEAPQSAALPQKAEAEKTYVEQIDEWHAARVERLKSETGWLSVVGLDWIEEGENTLGSGTNNQLQLPDGKAPGRVGSVFLQRGKLRIEAMPDSNLMHDETPVTTMELLPDTVDDTTVLTLGSLTFYVIQRGDRYALRVKDSKAEAFEHFDGVDRYPVDEKWRIVGHWVPYDPPKEITITNIVGIEEPTKILGAIELEIDGETYRLDPLADSLEEDLFLIFADETSGTETYGAGRYLYSDPPDENGTVIVDFNKAYNPPCVFTAFATCPLPPQQNRLPIAIHAGEKMWGGHDPSVPIE